jgi:hypothetical protein
MKYKLVLMAIVSLIFFSCKKENMCDCIKSSGTHIGTYRDVAGFNCIEVKDEIELYITQDSVFEVRVEAGKNLQSLIKTEMDGETLKVFNNNRCNWVRGYDEKIKVYVSAPYFKYLLNSGIGNIESINTITQDLVTFRTGSSGDITLSVNTGTLRASAHGNGDIYLSGTTNSLENDYTGTNFLYASDLQVANYVYLHSVSIGKAYVNAPQNGLMDVVIDQTGNIYYTGNPGTVNLTKNSTGDLIQQ